MAELIISVSGLRGIVGETLTPEVAIRYVTAFSAGTPDGPFVVTRDGRATGSMVSEAVMAGLHATGRTTIDGELLPHLRLAFSYAGPTPLGGFKFRLAITPPNTTGSSSFPPKAASFRPNQAKRSLNATRRARSIGSHTNGSVRIFPSRMPMPTISKPCSLRSMPRRSERVGSRFCSIQTTVPAVFSGSGCSNHWAARSLSWGGRPMASSPIRPNQLQRTSLRSYPKSRSWEWMLGSARIPMLTDWH